MSDCNYVFNLFSGVERVPALVNGGNILSVFYQEIPV